MPKEGYQTKQVHQKAPNAYHRHRTLISSFHKAQQGMAHNRKGNPDIGLDDNIGRRISVARSIGNSIFGKTNKVLALHRKPVHGHTFA